jgi:hypothetical protein
MYFKNVEINEDGTYEFDVQASPEEVNFLVSLSINMLLEAGVMQLAEGAELQQVDLPDEAQEYIASVIPSEEVH